MSAESAPTLTPARPGGQREVTVDGGDPAGPRAGSGLPVSPDELRVLYRHWLGELDRWNAYIGLGVGISSSLHAEEMHILGRLRCIRGALGDVAAGAVEAEWDLAQEARQSPPVR